MAVFGEKTSNNTEGPGESIVILESGKIVKQVTDMKAGDIVTFGIYQQDEDQSKGPEKIEWIVLDVEDHGALLLSRHVLEAMPFNEKLRRVPWKGCTLRKWLNRDFYKTAFTAQERSLIVETQLKNEDFIYFFRPVNTDTTDKIFLLSRDELHKYSNIEQEQFAEATPYAMNKGRKKIESISVDEGFYDRNLKDHNITRDVIGRTVAGWWVRSNSDGWKTTDRQWVVGVLGNGICLYLNEVGVRPALYVKW